MDYTSLNLIADGSKLLVENSSMPKNRKEYVKIGIDYAAALIKRFGTPSQVNFSVMGFSPDQLYKLKTAAKEYKLTEVILFPCPVNGVFVACLRMKGGDILTFLNAVGLKSLEDVNVNASEIEQNELIQRYGVVVYSSE